MKTHLAYKIMFKNKTEQTNEGLPKDIMLKVIDDIISNGSLMNEIDSIIISD